MIERLRLRLGLPREAMLIIGLFFAFRLMMQFTLRPEHITFFGDYPYYFELAQLSDQGMWPYLHYWMEYPPIFPFLSTIVYQLTAGSYDNYVLVIGAIMLLFNCGSLIVLMRLATHMHGEETATRIAWVYSLLFVPLIFMWWQFEAITAFTMLFALDRLRNRHIMSSAIATGLGVMVKLVPLLILPAVALTRPLRQTAIFVGVVVLVVLLIVAPLFAAAPETTRISFLAPLGWSSWQTVWALSDGNLRTGLLGGIDIHLDNALATTPVGNPSRVPDGLKAIGFGLLYVGILWSMRRHMPRLSSNLKMDGAATYRLVGLLAITYVVFVLWSKGWSPQWQMILIPLMLLMMPDTSGIGFVVIFGLVNLVEFPMLISRGLWEPVVITIVLRTLLLIVLLIEFVRRIRQPATPIGIETE